MMKEPKYVEARSDSYRELWQEYKRLAKQADQRLVRLEQLSNQEGYGDVLQYSYRKAMREIRAFSGETATRFNTAAPEGYYELLGKVNAIKDFIESPTSSKKGIKNVYQKRADTMNKKYGTNFTWQSLAKFLMSEQGKQFTYEGKGTGLKSKWKAIGKVQSLTKDQIADIKESDEKVKMITDSSTVESYIAEKLIKNGLNYEDLH